MCHLLALHIANIIRKYAIIYMTLSMNNYSKAQVQQCMITDIGHIQVLALHEAITNVLKCTNELNDKHDSRR